MSEHYDSHVHYRCAFDLERTGEVEGSWGDLIRDIRRWLASRTRTQNQLNGRWFYQGGEWRSREGSREAAQVGTIVGNSTTEEPEFWALSYEHPCSDSSFRQWRTEIGVTRLQEGLYHFVLTTTHRLLPGYIGEEPKPPSPTAPRIISDLLQSPVWSPCAGTQRLWSLPVVTAVGEGYELYRRIADPARACPLVYLSCDRETLRPKIDPESIARLLSGAAVVYRAGEPDLDEELDHYFLPAFRCVSGAIRIYQPRLQIDRESDARRHRFFTRQCIDTQTPAVVSDIIVRSIARRTKLHPRGVTSIGDLATKRRELRLAELRTTALTNPQREWISLLEAENQALVERSRELEQQIEDLDNAQERAEERIEELECQADRLSFAANELKKGNDQLEQDNQRLLIRLAAVESLDRLPKSLEEAIDLIERLHSGRIVFTERARRSASGYRATEVPKAWSCLWSMATVLYDLHFEQAANLRELASRYRETTGFELALFESETTKNNRSLASQRKDQFDGRTIDISSHVKIGRGRSNILRVHYHAHHDRRLIVVGHCGEHLDTVRTN
jgi:hypothetical protein